MSGDPKRWLDGDGGATDAERELLRSADDVEPAPGAHDATWAALATRLPPGGAPPGAGPTGGAGGAGGAASGSAIGAKAVAIGLIGAVVVVGAVVVMRSSRAPEPPPTSSPTAPAVVVTPTSTPVPVPRTDEPAPTDPRDIPQPAVTAATKGSGSAPALSAPRLALGRAASASTSTSNDSAPTSTGTAMLTADALRDEIALVAAARAALRSGDGPGALASLEKARKQHPRGALLQEREVLTIEALAKSGDAAGASRRASAFLRAFPTSPHAAHVRTFER